MNIKIKKVVNTTKKYVGNDKREHYDTRYYIVLENGQYISVRPCFKDGYNALNLICETETK